MLNVNSFQIKTNLTLLKNKDLLEHHNAEEKSYMPHAKTLTNTTVYFELNKFLKIHSLENYKLLQLFLKTTP